MFAFLGYYPIVKPKLDSLRLGLLWKLLLFNGLILVLYWILLQLLGLEQVVSDFEELATDGERDFPADGLSFGNAPQEKVKKCGAAFAAPVHSR